jgi:PAS domain S-box-containing protein
MGASQTQEPERTTYSGFLRYSAAVLLSGAALAITLGLSRYRPSAETPLFLLAVGVAAWLGGAGPAFVAALLCALSLDYFVFPVKFGWTLRTQDLIGLGSFLAVSAVIASIARRRSRAEHELHRSEERYGAFIANSSEGIWCCEIGKPISTHLPEDEQIEQFYQFGYLSECNDAFATMYGFSKAAELRGARLEDLLVRSDPQNLQYLRAFIRSGYRLTGAESHEVDRKGDVRHFSNNLVAIVENGFVARAWGTQQDVSEQKRDEEALRKAEKLAATGRLSASIAHEINNPLESVMNLLYLIGGNRSLDSGARRHLKLAEEELDRVAQITKQTLGFFRDNSAPAAIDVGETLDSVIAIYNQKLASKNVKIQREYEHATSVFALADEIRQVFSNMIANAIDAVPDGGQLTLKVRRARGFGEGNKPGVRILFADKGCGITREQQKKLFEPFFTTKKDVGTGLGLWVSKNIIEKHGGSISIRSSVVPAESWTVFSIFLPEGEGVLMTLPNRAPTVINQGTTATNDDGGYPFSEPDPTSTLLT